MTMEQLFSFVKSLEETLKTIPGIDDVEILLDIDDTQFPESPPEEKIAS